MLVRLARDEDLDSIVAISNRAAAETATNFAIEPEPRNEWRAAFEQTCERKFEREVRSSEIGELVVQGLSQLDEVAYVRFASVYKQFKDINQFMEELRVILAKD